MQAGTDSALLNREQEIAAAQQIEWRDRYRHSMLATDYMLQAALKLLEQVRDKKLRLVEPSGICHQCIGKESDHAEDCSELSDHPSPAHSESVGLLHGGQQTPPAPPASSSMEEPCHPTKQSCPTR